MTKETNIGDTSSSKKVHMDNERGGSPGISSSVVTSSQQQPKQQPCVQQQPQQQPVQVQQQNQQNKSQLPSGGPAAAPASNGEGRRISCEDIQLVQNLIERCLQLYMNQKEVINTLLVQAKIEPGFTSLVWQKLEEQNPDFFKAYYVRLKLKKQIVIFNFLLDQQAHLIHKMHPTKAALASLQNGIHASSVHHLPIGYPVTPQPPMPTPPNHSHMVQMHLAPTNPPVMNPEAFNAPQGSPGTNGVDMASGVAMVLPGGVSNVSSVNNEGMAQASAAQPNSTFPFGAVGNPTDMAGMGMDVVPPLDPSFSSGDAHNQNGMNALQINSDADTGAGREAFGLLGQLPRNFSLSDLTAELTNSSDLLGSYTGSPFLTSDADVYIGSPDRDCLDEKMLDHIPDSLSYEDFVTDK